MKIGRRSYELLNKQESSRVFMINCIGDLGRKYGSYLS